MVDADIPSSVDLLGKSVTDLQEDIEVLPSAIEGTLKYVTGYTGYSGDVSEQSGNYLALHFDVNEDVDYTTVELKKTGTTTTPKRLGEDGLAIFRITDVDTQTIEYKAYKGSNVQTKTLSLEDLELESEG